MFQSLMHFANMPIRKLVYHRHTPCHVIVYIHKNVFDHTMCLNSVKLTPERANSLLIGHNLKQHHSSISTRRNILSLKEP